MLKNKGLFFFIFLIIAFKKTEAQQNLVLNPSFEDTSGCPTNADEVFKAIGWASFGNSPDYFNSCGSTLLSVPSNFMGIQNAHTGSAYCGMVVYGSGSSYREFIGRQLSQPLEIGKGYSVSFYCCRGNVFFGAVNKIGLKFTTNPFTEFSPIATNNFSHLFVSSIITDSIYWTKVESVFYADSNYNYISLGNFFDDANTDTSGFWVNGQPGSYYYIDDISVIEDSLVAPNIFTPNNDGLNDQFSINGLRKDDLVIIYNRWGTRVYEFIGVNDSWDGRTTSGEKCSDGIYFYVITSLTNSASKTNKGFIHLMR